MPLIIRDARIDEAFTSEDDKEMAVGLLAEGLRTIHAISVVGCPFDQGLEAKLTIARKNASLVATANPSGQRGNSMNSQEPYQKLIPRSLIQTWF